VRQSVRTRRGHWCRWTPRGENPTRREAHDDFSRRSPGVQATAAGSPKPTREARAASQGTDEEYGRISCESTSGRGCSVTTCESANCSGSRDQKAKTSVGRCWSDDEVLAATLVPIFDFRLSPRSRNSPGAGGSSQDAGTYKNPSCSVE
jgi:hypothetical protein